MPKTCSICDNILPEKDIDGYVGLVGGALICFTCCAALRECPPEDDTISLGLLDRAKQRQSMLVFLITRTTYQEDLPRLQRALRGAIFLEYQMLCTSRWDELQRRLAAKKNIWA